METNCNLTVIIPAYNEAEGLGIVLPPIVQACRMRGWKLIVVNDASDDSTGQICRQFEPDLKLINNSRNIGYGASIKRGLRWAKTEWIATFDADGQHSLQDLLRLFQETDNCDAVIGRRRSKSHVDPTRIVGKWILGKVVNMLVGQKIPDINCGLRIIRRSLLNAISHLTADGFSFSTSTLVTLLKMGWEVKFIDITAQKRIGKSVVRQTRDGLQTILLIIRLITLFDPLRIMLPVGGATFLVGLVYQLVNIFLNGWDIYDLTTLLCVIGIMIALLGLVADQISALRRELTLRDYND